MTSSALSLLFVVSLNVDLPVAALVTSTCETVFSPTNTFSSLSLAGKHGWPVDWLVSSHPTLEGESVPALLQGERLLFIFPFLSPRNSISKADCSIDPVCFARFHLARLFFFFSSDFA